MCIYESETAGFSFNPRGSAKSEMLIITSIDKEPVAQGL